MDIIKSIVKITINYKDSNNENKIEQATGFLISSNDKNIDYIITVSHIFKNYQFLAQVKILSYFDSEYNFQIKEVNYQKSGEYSQDEDVAVIVVNKVNWHAKGDNYYLPEENEYAVRKNVEIAGFPVRIEDRHLNMVFLAISGQITSFVKSFYTVNVSIINEAGISLFESTQGMSGAPVYTLDNDTAILWGIQKGLPNKEYSYNTINVIDIYKSLDVIKKRYQKEIVLEVYNRELYRLKSIFRTDSMNCGTFYLTEVNSSLFPTVKENLGIRFYSSINENVSLVSFLEEAVIHSDKLESGLIIIGEGGCGKTVTLLEICKFCLEKSVYSIYIPLYIINEKEYETIDNYLLKRFWLDDIEAYRKFKSGLSLGKEMKLVLVLDGFNEVKNHYKRNIINDILDWKKISSVRIIVSSRYDFTKNYIALKNMRCLEIQPLNYIQIQDYLDLYGVKLEYSNKDKLISVLKTPLMLVLYTNVEKYHTPDDAGPILKWRDNCKNAGCILWNYIQSQYNKILMQNKDGIDTIYTVFTLEYICPYISRYMEKNNIYSLQEDFFVELIDKAIKYYEKKWKENISSRIHRIEREYELEVTNWDFKRIYSILTKELHLFIIQNENVTLLHQQFRDFFSAVFYILILKDKEAMEYWNKEPIDYIVLNYIAEIIEVAAVESIWEEIRGRTFTPKDYIVSNVIQIVRRINNDNGTIDLSQINFDRIDLRFVSLNGIQLTSERGRASFKKAKIAKYTLYPKGHSSSIYCMVSSADGNKAITGSQDRTLREWNLRSGECERILIGHTSYVQSVDYSPDEKVAISGDFYGGIILWDLKSSSVINHLQMASGLTKAVYGVKFLSDQMVISMSYDGETKLWDIVQKKCVKKFQVNTGGLRSLDVSPLKDKAVFGSYDGTIIQWNIRTGEMIGKVNLEQGSVRTVMYSKSGERVLAGCENGAICEYNIITNEVKHRFIAHNEKISNVAYSCDESKIISCSYDKKIKVWNIEQEEVVNEITAKESRYCANFLANKDLLIETGSDAGFELWNYVTCERLLKIEGAQYGFNIISCVFGKNHFVVFDKDTLCRLRNYEGYNEHTRQIKVQDSPCRQVQICDINKMEDSILCCNNGLVQKINLKSGATTDYIQLTYCEKAYFAFNKLLLLCNEDKKQKNLFLYDNEIKELKSINIPYFIDDVKYSDANDMAIAYSKYKVFVISNTVQWKCIYKGKNINYIQFLEDEFYIIIWLKNNNILKLDLRSEKVVYRYRLNIHNISIIDFSHYGNKAIYTMNDTLYEIQFENNKQKALAMNGIGIEYLKYICNDKKCIAIDKYGQVCIYDLDEDKVSKIIQHIDGMNIMDCDFTDADFEDNELRNLVQFSGGIV